jgi:hypothetical protein
MADEAGDDFRFQVRVHSVRVSELHLHKTFKSKLRVTFKFQEREQARDVVLESKKADLDGQEVRWAMDSSTTVVCPSNLLSERTCIVQLWQVLDSGKNLVGETAIDFHTLATGPREHSLPLRDAPGAAGSEPSASASTSAAPKQNALAHFSIVFEQITVVKVHFNKFEVSDLSVALKTAKAKHHRSMFSKSGGKKKGDGKASSSDDESVRCNPYLKYAFRAHWAAIKAGKKKAVYSPVSKGNLTPSWVKLPPLEFEATLSDMIEQAVTVHVNHEGTFHSVNMCKVNLLMSHLAASTDDDAMSDGDLVKFNGRTAVGVRVSGFLQFENLPELAQMRPLDAKFPCLHLDGEIRNAVPVLPRCPRPLDLPVVNGDDLNPNTPQLRIKGERENERQPEHREDFHAVDLSDRLPSLKEEPDSPPPVPKLSVTTDDSKKVDVPVVDDLIDLSTPRPGGPAPGAPGKFFGLERAVSFKDIRADPSILPKVLGDMTPRKAAQMPAESGTAEPASNYNPFLDPGFLNE